MNCKKILLIFALLAFAPASADALDITSTGELGTAVSGDYIVVGDSSEPAESQPHRTLFSGNHEATFRDDGTFEVPDTYTTGEIDTLLEPIKYENGGVVTLPTITNNGDGTVDVGADGLFNFYKDSTGTVGVEQLAVSTILDDQVLSDNTLSYIYADYNSGTPLYGVTTTAMDFLSNADWVAIFRVFRAGNELHVTDYDAYGVALSSKTLYKDIILNSFERQSGLVLSTSPTRISTVSSGSAWFGVQLFPRSENISGTAGQLFEYYPVAGVWTETEVTEYDSSYYSDGTNRIALSANRWVPKYFFGGVEDDNHVYFLHGNQYTSALLAELELLPGVPVEISSHSIYLGKIVIQEGAADGTAHPRLWDEAVYNSVTNHDDLANINQATTGITNGHINDQAQNIAGSKTFIGDILANNLSGTNTGDQTAAQVTSTPTGDIVSTNVDAAIAELEAEKQDTITTQVVSTDVAEFMELSSKGAIQDWLGITVTEFDLTMAITDTTGTGSMFTVDSIAATVADTPKTWTSLSSATEAITFSPNSTEISACTGTGVTGSDPNWLVDMSSANVTDAACTVTAASVTSALDDFNRADSATLGALSGGTYTWVDGIGDIQISGNTATGLADQMDVSILTPTISTNSGTFTANVNAGLSPWGYAGVVFGYVDSNNYWRVMISPTDPVKKLEIVQVVAGSDNSVSTETPAISVNVDYIMTVRITATTIQVDIDGVGTDIIDITGLTIPSGNVGMASYSTVSLSGYLDNFNYTAN